MLRPRTIPLTYSLIEVCHDFVHWPRWALHQDEFLSNASPARLSKQLRQKKNENSKNTYEYKLLTIATKYKQIAFHITPLFCEEDELQGYIAVMCCLPHEDLITIYQFLYINLNSSYQ